MKKSIAKRGADPRFQTLFLKMYGSAFSKNPATKVLIIYEPHRIAFSQVFPFLMFADQFAAQYDCQIRFLPRAVAEEGIGPAHREATHVLVRADRYLAGCAWHHLRCGQCTA